jgi:hypothetical protein
MIFDAVDRHGSHEIYFEEFFVFVRHSFPTALQTLHRFMIQSTDDGKHRVEILQIFATFYGQTTFRSNADPMGVTYWQF